MNHQTDISEPSSPKRLGRIMLVDDDTFDIMMYKRIIARSGLVDEIVSFASAEEALAYLLDPESPGVELILLDINMPIMTGFDFMEAASKALGPDFGIPVVMMLTTSISERDRDRAATFSPIKAYLNKPLDPEHLANAAEIVARELQR